MERQGKTLYLECGSGISGDMAVAALLDLGADREVLDQALRSVPVEGFQVEIGRVKKAGLDVCDFRVILDEPHENRDHDMGYLFGETGEHCHGTEDGHHHGAGEEHHHHGAEGEHHHDAREGHHHHKTEEGHHHEHRNLTEILHIIEHADMTKKARETAGRIFRILAEAEAKAHGVPMEEVHFHEVGAVDSIVDIIAAAVCLDNLGVTECIVPALCEGRGTVRCQHGILNVPVPAVLNIVEAYRLRLSITETRGELVTPTGAAIAAAVKTADELPRAFRIVKTGMGGGKREYERPSILRAMLIEGLTETVICGNADNSGERDHFESNEKTMTGTVSLLDGSVENMKNTGEERDRDVIYKLETNIDDCSGEVLGYVLERLLAAGAKDAHYVPVYMKKNRPAYQLTVLCDEKEIPALEEIMFAETTTIGIRRQRMERSVLPRRIIEVEMELGRAKVKECRLPGRNQVKYYPEYGSVIGLCEASGKPFREVYRLIMEKCGESRRPYGGDGHGSGA